MAIFGPKPWVNPAGKMSIFRLFEPLVFIAQKGFFCSRISSNTFSWPILSKKKTWKNGHFWTKTMFLNFLFLQPRKACFFVLECHKRHFAGLYCVKKKSEKWTFLDQNLGLTPLEKCQCFNFMNFLFLQPRNAFFRSRIP